jgi:peptidoglycan biosynthesis protein MviN/MurJ (putative lipid II flippase)
MLVILLLQGEGWVRLVFEHGQFDADDTRLVTEALIYLAFSMLPYFARDTLTRVFYAFGDAKTPLMVGVHCHWPEGGAGLSCWWGPLAWAVLRWPPRPLR